MGTGNLEIHIAKEILQPLNIGQNKEVLVALSGHESAADSRHMLLDRDSRCH